MSLGQLSRRVTLQDVLGNLVTTTDLSPKVGLDVNLAGSDVAIGGGTQYTEGDTDTTITGTAVMFEVDTSTSTLGVVSADDPLPIIGNVGIAAQTLIGEPTHDRVAVTSGAATTVIAVPSGVLVRQHLSVQNTTIGTIYVTVDGSTPSAINGYELNVQDILIYDYDEIIPQTAVQVFHTLGAGQFVRVTYLNGAF